LLLTGGASRRLGAPKANLLLDGERLVDRASRAMSSVCDPAFEVGKGTGALPLVRDDPPGRGPLAAVADGGAALIAHGHNGATLVLAVDVPGADVALLTWLAAHPSLHSVVPRVAGMPQSLCARYSAEALAVARQLVDAGERSMRALLASTSIEFVDEDEWGTVATAASFADVDTPADAARAGVDLPG
jgi:molybdopterin-guanine dinucleotide biosynthesis protein A